MRQKHFYLTLLVTLALSFFSSEQILAAWDMGEEKLGNINITRGETVTINATRIDKIYGVTEVLGWYGGSDCGFYAHSYQNDRRSEFSVTGYATCYQKELRATVYYTQSDGTECYKKFYYLVTVTNDSYTKVERDIELAAAGTLSWRINSSDKNNITHLTLHGDLNGSDLKFLREMAGYNDNQGNLRYLDLRDVHFVAGGGDYVTFWDYTPSVYEGYDLPDGAFYWCRKLTEIWLPAKLGRIGTYAFYHCDFLTTVHILEGAHTVWGAAFDVCYNLKELSIPSTIKTFYPTFSSSDKFSTLYCHAAEPPTRGTYALFANCTNLYVPQGCKQKYLVKEGWGAIANIYETLPIPKVLVSSISLNKTSLSLGTGKSETLTATVLPDNAADKTVSWTSSNTSIATVDDNGKVTAVATGTATITCSANDVSGVKTTCSVTVADVYPTSISMRESLSMKTADTYTLSYYYKYPSGTTSSQKVEPSVTWSSSNTGVVTVSDGTITAVSPGTAIVKVNSANGLTASCNVTVIAQPEPFKWNVKQVEAGYYHTMILLTDGTLWACGYNEYGQLGDGSTTDRSTPMQVMTDVEAVSAIYQHTMILKTDGTLWAWGNNG
jgi:uncharacterized protein YjdB